MSWYYQSKLDAVISVLKYEGQFKLAQQVQTQALLQQVQTQNPPNLCEAPANLCPQSKGIERSKMPQFDSKTGWMFLSDLGKKGIAVTHEVYPVGELKASQSEISAKAVMHSLGSLQKPANEEAFVQSHPIFASADMFVLDGHHRWASLLVYSIVTRGDSSEAAPVIKIAMPFDQLIVVANSSSEAGHSSFESAGQPKNFTPQATEQTAMPSAPVPAQ